MPGECVNTQPGLPNQIDRTDWRAAMQSTEATPPADDHSDHARCAECAEWPRVSPPADDVREAREWIEELLSGNGFGADYSAEELDAWAMDLIGKVRLRGAVTDAEEELSRLEQIAGKVEASRGQVTDAELERVARLLWADYDAEHAGSTVNQFFGQARRLLEAARGARVSAENTTPTNHANGGDGRA